MVIVKLKSGLEYYIDGIVKSNLDSLVYNVKNDWDFVIVISGNNMVRVGKSVLAQQIGAYMADRCNTTWSLDNINMNAKDMISFAMKAQPNSVIVYDEAAEGLRAAKNAKDVLDSLLDFFDECGQLNHIFIIVAPNFFRLKSDITIERSEFLLNVYRVGTKVKDEFGQDVVKLQRGVYQFFDRKKKQALYERFIKTKTQNYSGGQSSLGNFRNIYTVDTEKYKEKKKLALRRMKESRPVYYKKQFDKLIAVIRQKYNLTSKQLSEDFEIDLTDRQIRTIISNQEEIRKQEAAVEGGVNSEPGSGETY
jgi:hypothetical protein